MKSNTKLTGKVIFRGEPGYDAARKNWDPHTDRFPKVFVFARTAKDVSNAIKWARENDVPIRARSGRHALEGDLSQVTGGIVIDVSKLNEIKLNKAKGTVVVGAGNRVGRLAHALAKRASSLRSATVRPSGSEASHSAAASARSSGRSALSATI